MSIPYRHKRLKGRHAHVDGIRFVMPVTCWEASVMVAAFLINWDKARMLLPPGDIHPLRLWKRAVLSIVVLETRRTDIGAYVEHNIGIACTHGARPAPPLLPSIFPRLFGTGVYVCDLPVSSEIAVKAGKGIWGMPKHQANLDFIIGERWISSQYDLDGRMVYRLDIRRPKSAWVPANGRATAYSMYRGMMLKSATYFHGRAGVHLRRPFSARLIFGDHPRAVPIRTLELDPHPIYSAFVPDVRGVLDDHFECWFVTHEKEQVESVGEGLESIFPLGYGRDRLSPPQRDPGFNVNED
jgi:hypothetical protein